ncbi:hypothetical protein ACROYT_G032385 [Oculina patagonica]
MPSGFPSASEDLGARNDLKRPNMATTSKSPLPPRPQSVPLLRKTMSPDPSNVKASPTRAKTPLNKLLGKSLNLKSGPVPGLYLFGTPSYPSPLDRIRPTKKDRAVELGLSTALQDSLDLNATFPKAYKPKSKLDEHNMDVFKPNRNLDQISSDSLHSFSYSPGHCRGSFLATPPDPRLTSSWQFYNFVGGAGTGAVFPTTVRNPNKAIVTINARTSEILTANDMAAELFGYSTQRLIGIKLSQLFADVHKEKQEALVEQHIEASGAVVMVNGKVLEAVDSCGIVFPVSVWMKKLTWDEEPRCITVMEPVERKTAMVLFDAEGTIVDCDQELSFLYGYHAPSDLVGVNITKLIPALQLPTGTNMNKHVKKQRATGRTRDGATFPLSITLKPKYGKDLKKLDRDKDFPDDQVFYKGMVWVFANISGLVTFTPDGVIHSCNHNFSLVLFGYPEKELIGKHMTDLIPNFYDDMDDIDDNSMPLPPFDDEDDEFEDDYDDDDFLENDRKSTVIYSRELDSKASNYSAGSLDGKNLDDSISSSLSTSTGLSSSHSTVESITCKTNRSSSRDVQSPPTNSTFLNKESMVANFGDSKVGNSFSESSFPSLEAGSFTPGTNAEDSGIDDRSGSIEKVRLEIGEEGPVVRGGPVAVSSPADVSTSPTEGQGEDKESLSGSFSSDPNKNEIYSKGNEKDEDLKESLEINKEVQQATSPQSSANTSETYSLPSTNENHSSVDTSLAESQGQNESPKRLPTPPEGSNFKLEGLTSTPNIIKKIELNDGRVLYCAWISRDPEEEGEGGRSTSSFALASSFNTTDFSVTSIAELSHHLSEGSVQEEPSPGCGRYDERYITLQSIGKGAFGFVKVGQRRSDGLKVIVKFIRKAKILADCWVDDSVLGSIPLEIALLAKLKHPNIVKMLEAFENEEFFQMVMEKHGSGMDLFEFIDRQPATDEALCSYLFRQVVSAVSFLHSRSILHRDVKDENIILDDKFHIKLIDFGSAAYMEEGKKFSTFCGTMEYCSPEVLMGNKYTGPQLELWSMGVTLYTLVFGENPFYDVEETIRAELHPPYAVSNDLMFIICWLLHPDPRWRATITDLEENEWINQPVDITKYSFDAVLGDQLDGSQQHLQLPVIGLNDSQSDADITQDEVIEYGNQDNLQLSALQEYLSMIDNDDNSDGET